jgi:TRAP-type transport system periplasmic protein
MRALRVLVLLIALSLIATFSAFSNGEQEASGPKEVVLIINGANKVGSLEDQMIAQFAKYVNERNEAGLTIKHIPGDSLGSAPQVLDQIASGTVDMLGNELAWVAPFDQDLTILNWGFTFRDRDHMSEFFNSDLFQDITKRIIESKNVRILGVTPAQPRLIFSMKDINSMADFNGFKVRVPQVKVWMEMKKAWGASPTPLAFGEVFLAMKTGMIEGGGGPVSAAYANNYHKVAKYMVNLGHITSTEMLLINEDSYQKLSAAQKKVLEEEAARAIAWANEAAQKETSELLAKMETEGEAVYKELADTTDFRTAMAAAAAKMEDEGLWSKGLYEKIQSIK